MSDIILLNDITYDGVKNLPLFEIKYLPITINLKEYDALIFTSKNAVKAIDSFNPSWKTIDCYCIAPKTAKIVKNLGGQVKFVGTKSHGNDFALELLPILQNKKALYIKAQKTVSKLVDILQSNKVDIEELTAYKTSCIKQKIQQPNKNSVIIFTAPSSVECFFEKLHWDKSYKAIVIGKTTAKYVPKEVEYLISPIQSIESCIKLAQSIIN